VQEVLGETECDLEWIQLAQGGDQSQTVVVTVINLRAYNRRDIESPVSYGIAITQEEVCSMLLASMMNTAY
jgi:hypothetical protein